MKRIERPDYLNRLIGLRNTPDIKIITGIRRSGKSELMRSYIDYINSIDANANVIYVDFFNLDYDELKDYKALNNYVKGRYKAGKNNYLFVDEIQLCNKFELVINSFHNSGNYDIYITGSNAFLLSSDLATLFTGRYIEIHIFPFSFKEYCNYYSEEKADDLLDRYLMQGGLAGSYVYNSENDKRSYIADVYATIVKRDLVDKYNLPDTVVLEHLSSFLMDNISNLISPNKIADTISGNITETNHVTIGRYVKYLCSAYMFYDIKRYDIRGKSICRLQKSTICVTSVSDMLC